MIKHSTQAIIHFAHANGFPAQSYQRLFAQLQPELTVLALDKFAHNPQFPVTRGWQNQVDEMMSYLDSQSREPVFAVGHSFGAVVSYLAVCQHPDRFRGLIMLDPPLITGLTSWIVKTLRPTPLFDKFTPAKLALNRATQWPAQTNMVEYFAKKALFKDMHLQCIEDYVSCAITSDEQGHQLSFDHKAEAEIFRTIPLNINKMYGSLRRPALLITGEKTNVCLERQIRPFINKNGLQHQVVAGAGHMFPLEKPDEVGEIIKQRILLWCEDEA